MATYAEYISRKVKPLGLSDDDVADMIGEAGLNAKEVVDYTKANMAIYNCFDSVLKYTTCNQSEGGLSISWNIEAIKLFYGQLCVKLGKPNTLSPSPRLRDKSNRW